MDATQPNQTGTSKLSLTSSGSISSTPSITPISTPNLEAHEFVGASAPKVVSSVEPLVREFPKPAEEINVRQALERQPGRWTIKGQMEANQRRAQHSVTFAAEDKEKKAQDFEATKRDLLAYHQSFQQSFGKN